MSCMVRPYSVPQSLSSATGSAHAGSGFDVAGDGLVGGEPYPGTRAYVPDEFLKDAHARAVPDDMGVHGE
jgi:hypothetical protein